MSPTVFQVEGLRFFFFSLEEPRVHVHVMSGDGEAKIWLKPVVEVARNHGLRPKDLRMAVRIIREREDEIREAWERHFRR